MRRAALTSVVVGTVLLAINQGDLLLSGQWSPSLLWRVLLTFLVPFCVSLHAGCLASWR